MNELTMSERIKRDGDRWRYIYLLEDELKNLRLLRLFFWWSLAMNAVLLVALIWVKP